MQIYKKQTIISSFWEANVKKINYLRNHEVIIYKYIQ